MLLSSCTLLGQEDSLNERKLKFQLELDVNLDTYDDFTNSGLAGCSYKNHQLLVGARSWFLDVYDLRFDSRYRYFVNGTETKVSYFLAAGFMYKRNTGEGTRIVNLYQVDPIEQEVHYRKLEEYTQFTIGHGLKFKLSKFIYSMLSASLLMTHTIDYQKNEYTSYPVYNTTYNSRHWSADFMTSFGIGVEF